MSPRQAGCSILVPTSIIYDSDTDTVQYSQAFRVEATGNQQGKYGVVIISNVNSRIRLNIVTIDTDTQDSGLFDLYAR